MLSWDRLFAIVLDKAKLMIFSAIQAALLFDSAVISTPTVEK
jgi:hypothetical protein